MAAILPMQCSFKLNSCKAVCRCRLVATCRNTVTMANATSVEKNPINAFVSQELSLKPDKLFIVSETSTRDRESHSSSMEEEIIGRLVQRLENAVERIREVEMARFMSRVKGELSEEDAALVEELSIDIVNNYLEKPLKHLRSCQGNFDERMKDVSFLVNVLEESCLLKIKD